jgi:splicing suppressor protein 51
VFDEKEHDVPKLALTRDKRTWQDYRHVAAPFDPYTDVFFLFSPGFGHPINKHKWKDAVKHMLDSKCIVVVTGYHAQDVQADVEWMERELEGEFVWLLKSGENAFKSLKADVNPEDLREFNWTNWGVWAIRGKRYDVIE